LANERTFLAWIRTALALIAGGVALEALGLGIQPGLRIIASLLLIVCGVAAAVLAWRGWMRAERALRRSASLPTPGYFLPVVMVVAAVGVLIFTAVLIR
jgi:putative membrane protein